MPPSITAVGLSKRYRSPASPDGWLDALKDVSFEIEAGEAVGLFGRNGAGKSTLLRVLSRVTRPTAGYADVYGRVGALLEVGTGFHPDLTGRENTHLSGAMLGLSKREVQDRFDRIVDFAEIAPFIDMPVKRYSSGMFARLGFAVAAHLRPEILIVDEVLAVGDLPFQARCLSLMHSLTAEGTTVLFVSHNLLAVADLCSRGLVMAGGRLNFDGTVQDAITAYRQSVATPAGLDPAAKAGTHGTVTINGLPSTGEIRLQPNDRVRVDLEIDRPADQPDLGVILNLVLEASDGRPLVHLRSDMAGEDLQLRSGRNVFGVVITELPLAAGAYGAWLRLVGLDPREPLIWDSDRMHIAVEGDTSIDAVVQPDYRFEQGANVVAVASANGARRSRDVPVP